jgi:hypothetical protein
VLVELRRLDEARAALAAVTASGLVRQRAEIEKKLAAARARAVNPDIVVTGGTVGPPAEENPPAEEPPPAEAAPPVPSGATGTASPPP